jgi:cell division protein FtsN
VVILGGVSFLFTRLSARPEYSYEPIQKNLGKIARKARENAPAQSPQPAPEKGSTGTYDEVWNMLVPRGQESPGPERYVVQIAAFRTREDAARKEDELREKIRLDCDVEMRDGLYMLTYGSFRTRESAERTCSTLRSRLRQECVVMQY